MTRKPLPRMASVATLVKLARIGAPNRHWYEVAYGDIFSAARALDVAPATLADLLALFSPRVSVTRSIRMTLHYLDTGEFLPDVTRSTRAAIAHWQATGKIRGPKTAAFARALLGYGSAIVLDVWMARAFRIDQRQLARPAVYARCSDRIRAAARILGWTPAETQAAIWAAVRNGPRSRFVNPVYLRVTDHLPPPVAA